MFRILVILFAFSSNAYAAQDFCPEGLPYYFTKFRDVLLINRMNHKAFCAHQADDKYECLEKWLVDDEPSVYNVRAQFTTDGKLLFTTEPDGDFWPAIGECK